MENLAYLQVIVLKDSIKIKPLASHFLKDVFPQLHGTEENVLSELIVHSGHLNLGDLVNLITNVKVDKFGIMICSNVYAQKILDGMEFSVLLVVEDKFGTFMKDVHVGKDISLKEIDVNLPINLDV